MDLTQATTLLLQLHQERRTALVERTDSYGTGLDESIKAINALVKALAEKQAAKLQASE